MKIPWQKIRYQKINAMQCKMRSLGHKITHICRLSDYCRLKIESFINSLQFQGKNIQLFNFDQVHFEMLWNLHFRQHVIFFCILPQYLSNINLLGNKYFCFDDRQYFLHWMHFSSVLEHLSLANFFVILNITWTCI